MNYKKTIINKFRNFYDNYIVFRKRHFEIMKFQDSRRVDIYSRIILSKDQEERIDNLFETNYGEKISYTWHRYFTAFTGVFDVNYFPELLYIPEFEHFMNLDLSYCKVIADKNLIPLISKAMNVDTPQVLLSATQGVLRNSKYEQIDKSQFIDILSNLGEAFCKPSTDSSSGRGCYVIKLHNGYDDISGKSAEEILCGLGNNFVIQERIKCHKTIEILYPTSVNTFRIITYRWKDNLRFMPVIMRIGRGGSFLDNAHAGGMFIAVEPGGTLHKKAFTEFKTTFTCHPDTNVVFENYSIPLVNTVIETAKRMHMALPNIGVINWDFTIGSNGNPILIEANLMSGSVWLPQIAHGCGAFGKDTAEVLRWLKVMKKTPVNERSKFAFGKEFE